MIDHKLTKEIKKFASDQLGADLVGICRAKDLTSFHPRQNPKFLMTSCSSVIVYGLKHLAGPLLSPVMRTSLVDTMNIYRELGRIGYQIGRFLEKAGFQAIWIHPAYPVELDRETKGLRGADRIMEVIEDAGIDRVFGLPGGAPP